MDMVERNMGTAWRGGVYLCTTRSSFEADILESKLRSENIPCLRKYRGASNFLEIAMGANTTHPIDIYVPEAVLEDAKNAIVAVPLDDDFDFEGEGFEFGDEEFDDEDFDHCDIDEDE
jgi:hypothetical protein